MIRINEIENQIATDLWIEFEPMLKRICKFKMQSCQSEIEDVIADTFLAFCKSVEKNGLPDCPKAWLYNVLYKQINSRYRQLYMEKAKTTSIDEQHKLPFDKSFEDEIIDRIFIEDLKVKLDEQLNEKDKELYNCVYDQKLKMKQIAKMLNTTESAIKQKHYRLCKKIRKIAKEKN